MDAAVTVREIMTREYLGVSESDLVADAVDLMLSEGTAGVVVLRGSDPVGMLTAADALELAGSGEAGETGVGSVMSGTAPTIPPDGTVAEAAGAMADDGVGSLLVTDGDELLGLVTERDIVRAVATLADRPGSTEPSGPADREPVAAVGAGEATPGSGGGTEYSTQSVCENCGSLTPDLRNFNGQLICGDCREV